MALTALVVTLGAGILSGVASAPARAATGDWVVSLGDSYISGEAGRWAGSSNASYHRADALGRTAYLDNATHTAETIPGCHRSSSAEILIAGGANGANLACSGARTSTFTDSTGHFKPGLDFATASGGRQGQAAALRDFAGDHHVRMVVVSIGGNDFNFASIVQSCVTDFLTSPSWLPNYCNDDSSVRSNFTASNVRAVSTRIAAALSNVRTAMRDAGYPDTSWRLLVQTYPSPLPTASGLRYGQSGYGRQFTGGCGLWNRDLDWANAMALPTINAAVRQGVQDSGVAHVAILDLSAAFDGRRLCEKGVGLYEEVGLAGWQSSGAVDRTEWVNQIRTVSTVIGPYQLQESLHPNYWGQLAVRSCVRQAYAGGAVRGGACARSGTGLSSLGEPVMTLR
jgi:hypothetical protein